MPTWSTIVLFLATASVLVVTPGPVVMYIIASSLNQGRQAGFVSALGVSVGTLVHVIDSSRGAVIWQMLLFGCLLVVLGFCNDSLYVILAGTASKWLRKNTQLVKIQRYFSSCVYVLLGVITALVETK